MDKTREELQRTEDESYAAWLLSGDGIIPFPPEFRTHPARDFAARVRLVNERTDLTGMTRPARPAAKRDELVRRGGLGPFGESPHPRPTDAPARRR